MVVKAPAFLAVRDARLQARFHLHTTAPAVCERRALRMQGGPRLRLSSPFKAPLVHDGPWLPANFSEPLVMACKQRRSISWAGAPACALDGFVIMRLITCERSQTHTQTQNAI